MGSILAIDYGLKRIGLAISDEEKIFAFPYNVIENKNLKYVLLEISNIVLEKEIDLIIVGMPYNMPGSGKLKGEMAEKVEEFVKHLSESVKIPIETVDERLSSFAASENLKESSISSRDYKMLLDKEAARLLLEEYIENSKKM